MNEGIIRQYINDFINNPKTVSSNVLDEVTITNVQTIIDEYDNSEDLFKSFAISSKLKKILREELTDEKIQTYRLIRLSHIAEVLSYKEKIKKQLLEEDFNDITFSSLIEFFKEDLTSDNSAHLEAIMEIFISIMISMAKSDKLTKEDVNNIKKIFHNVSYSIDYMIDRKRFQFDLDGLAMLFELQERFDTIETVIQRAHTIYCKKVKENQNRQVIDGITLVGESRKKLKDLVDYYNDLKEEISSVSSNYFLQLLGQENLIITTIAPPNYFNKSIDSCYIKDTNIIYFDEKTIKQHILPVLFHEGEHFIDSFVLNNRLHSTLQEVIDSLRKKITNDNIKQFLLDYQREIEMWNNYLAEYEDDIKEILVSDLKNEDLNYQKLSKNDQDALLNNLYNKYTFDFTNSKMFSSGYNAVFDILDGLSKGLLQKKFPNYEVGHGVLFSVDESTVYKEVLAEVSLLYNIGCPNLLTLYFPYDEVRELISIYENSINVDFLQFRIISYNNTMQTVNSIINYLNNHDDSNLSSNIQSEIKHMDSFMVRAAIVTYNVAANYLEEAMWQIDEKYGIGSFMNSLIQYEMDDDIGVFPDTMLQTYISMLDDGQIHMFLHGDMAQKKSMKK